MDASVAGSLTANPGPGPEAAARGGIPSAPGWIVLRDCPLGGGGPPVGLALLHPKIGVALVDFAPVGINAADRFRRALDARRFPAIFAGYPPVVWVVLPEDHLPDLGHVLSARFKEEPPFALEGGDAWLPTARTALEAKPAAADPRQPAAGRRDIPPWRAAVYSVGAAACGAAVAAVVIAAPPRRGVEALPADPAATTASVPARLPATAAMPADLATAPHTAEFRPPRPAPGAGAGETAVATPQEAGSGGATDSPAAGVPFAAAPQEAGNEPAPVPAAEHRPEPPTVDLAVLPAEPIDRARATWPPEAVPDPMGADATPSAPPPTRAAGVAPPPMRDAPSAPKARDRRAPSPAGAPPAAESASAKRCREILIETSLGGPISNADKEHLRRGCQQPRN